MNAPNIAVSRTPAERQYRKISNIIEMLEQKKGEYNKDEDEYKKIELTIKRNKYSIEALSLCLQKNNSSEEHREICCRMLADAFTNASLHMLHKTDEIQDAMWELEQKGYQLRSGRDAFNLMKDEYGEENLIPAIEEETPYVKYVISAIDNKHQNWLDYEWIMNEDDSQITASYCCEVCEIKIEAIRSKLRSMLRMNAGTIIKTFLIDREMEEGIEMQT